MKKYSYEFKTRAVEKALVRDPVTDYVTAQGPLRYPVFLSKLELSGKIKIKFN